MVVEIVLLLCAACSALLGVLTLTSTNQNSQYWKRTSSIAKLLALNSFIVLGFGLAKIYLDKIEDDKKDYQLSKLERSLKDSLLKQSELKTQLRDAEYQLKKTIENASEMELRYYQSKDTREASSWITAFKAERNLNAKLLEFLANKMDSNTQFVFLHQPEYLKINYLRSMINSPHTDDQFQLEKITMLYDELNKINEKIMDGSNAVIPGNHEYMMTGISRFLGVEKNARNALNLYFSVTL